MTITTFIIIAAVVFIVGVLLVVKGISAEEQEAVPISNPEEIRALKKAFVPPQETSAQPTDQPTPVDESGQSNLKMLEENHQLRKELNDQRVRFEDLEKDMEALKNDYLKMQEHKSGEDETLKQEKARFYSEKESLMADHALLNELKGKTEALEKQYDEAQRQRTEMNIIINQLKAEKDALRMQIKMRDEQMETQVREQRVEASRVEFGAMSNKLVESIATIEDLKRENKDLQKINEQLQETCKKAEDLNAHLTSKEKTMQYELTKNRAQALGLEKICEDFRAQIELMSAAAER